jgi:hypothetical protein
LSHDWPWISLLDAKNPQQHCFERFHCVEENPTGIELRRALSLFNSEVIFYYFVLQEATTLLPLTGTQISIMTFHEPITQWLQKLQKRDSGNSPADQLLDLLKDPFSGTVS